MVALGFSSMIQCPESGTTPSSTSLAAKRITAAIVLPNDFSPPSARTGTIELARRDEGPVFGGVLVEGRELRKARMHRARAGIELRVVPSGRLTEPLWGGGELVPEPVKVDALATGDQALHVRAAEAEVP